MTATPPRHRFVEHTGELELRSEAPDFASLIEEAARALAEIMAEDAGGAPTREPERVELTATDRDSLLVDCEGGDVASASCATVVLDV